MRKSTYKNAPNKKQENHRFGNMKEQETKDEVKKDKHGNAESKKQQAKSGKTESKVNSKAGSKVEASAKGGSSKKSGKVTAKTGASAKNGVSKKNGSDKAGSKKSAASAETAPGKKTKSGAKKSGSKKSGSAKTDSLKSANLKNGKGAVNDFEESGEDKASKTTETHKASNLNALVVKIKSLFSKKSNKNSAEQAEGKRYSVKSNNPAVRAKAVQQARKRAAARSKGSKKRPRKWLVPTFITFLIVGLIWIVLYYLSKSWPIPGLGDFNIFIGFALIVIGVVLATFWE